MGVKKARVEGKAEEPQEVTTALTDAVARVADEKKTPEPTPAPAPVPAPPPPAAIPAVVETINVFARSGEAFAKAAENLLRAVERLNTVAGRLEAKVTVPDGFATCEQLEAAKATMVSTTSVMVNATVDRLKNELTAAFNALGRAVCEACGKEWEDENRADFFPDDTRTSAPELSENGDLADAVKELAG